MIRFAVCDDEPAARQALEALLSEHMQNRARTVCRVSCFADGGALLASGQEFDVIFLDIRMTRPDGMETARRLRQRGSRSLLIFVTALAECVYGAFEVEAFDFLCKPVDAARLGRTVDRALGALRRRESESLAVRRGGGCEFVALAQIVYCEVQGRKVYLHRADGAVTDYYERLEALEQKLDSRFFRCHRSYLVNLDYVRGCAAGQLLLPGGAHIPVSRLRERALADALLRRMSTR